MNASDLIDTTQPRFGFVLADWLQHPEVGVNEAAVLSALSIHADKQGECYPGQKLMGTLLRRHRDWISNVIDHLVEIGLLERTLTRSGYRYRFLVWKAPQSDGNLDVAPGRHRDVGCALHRDVGLGRHKHHQRTRLSEQESPLPHGQEGEGSSDIKSEDKKERRRKLNPTEIAEAFNRAARRVAEMQEREQVTKVPESASPPGATATAVALRGSTLPTVTLEETSDVGWVVSFCRDNVPIDSWAKDVRVRMLESPDLLTIALERRVRAMQGADPATIAQVLRSFQSRLDAPQDGEALESELTADIWTLTTELPADLLPVAWRKMTAGWKAGFKKRPGAGDLLAAVQSELRLRKDEIRYLKTGLERVLREKERQDRAKGRL